ncbi:hypothetical protein V8G54_023820 [Vigna mungo]|uniref:Uncharacterized protein n=1 Tax=Vigna mungo TaxID=3915 RepID=A0AAQ3N4U4_VIGMU
MDWLAKTLQALVGFILIGTVSALLKVVFLRRARYAGGVVTVKPVSDSSNVNKTDILLTKHQQGLLGVRPKVDLAQPDSAKKLPNPFPAPLGVLHLALMWMVQILTGVLLFVPLVLPRGLQDQHRCILHRVWFRRQGVQMEWILWFPVLGLTGEPPLLVR